MKGYGTINNHEVSTNVRDYDQLYDKTNGHFILEEGDNPYYFSISCYYKINDEESFCYNAIPEIFIEDVLSFTYADIEYFKDLIEYGNISDSDKEYYEAYIKYAEALCKGEVATQGTTTTQWVILSNYDQVQEDMFKAYEAAQSNK